MSATAPLLDLGTARRLVQEHVGADADIIACWQRPKMIYGGRFTNDSHFYFAISDAHIAYVGGTRHVAIDRRTGEIIELGNIGE